MKKAKRRAGPPRRSPGDSVSGAFRAAWLYGGIPFLAVTAVLIAARRALGLADLLYWIGVVWIAMVRYVEFASAAGESLQPGRAALRRWRRFSAILVVAAAALYALARIAAGLGRT